MGEVPVQFILRQISFTYEPVKLNKLHAFQNTAVDYAQNRHLQTENKEGTVDLS
jgi:hypothetical protein